MANPSPQIDPLNPMEVHALAQMAITAKSHAYCPYSNFRVGCAILTARPSTSALTLGSERVIFTGANVEIAATPVGTCAERCALASLVASFKRPEMPVIRAVVVASDVEPPASPCGMCRQFIREFADENTPIYMIGKDEKPRDNYEMKTIAELLPMSFGPNDMDRNKEEAKK